MMDEGQGYQNWFARAAKQVWDFNSDAINKFDKELTADRLKVKREDGDNIAALIISDFLAVMAPKLEGYENLVPFHARGLWLNSIENVNRSQHPEKARSKIYKFHPYSFVRVTANPDDKTYAVGYYKDNLVNKHLAVEDGSVLGAALFSKRRLEGESYKKGLSLRESVAEVLRHADNDLARHHSEMKQNVAKKGVALAGVFLICVLAAEQESHKPKPVREPHNPKETAEFTMPVSP